MAKRDQQTDKDKLIARLRRVEGQVSAIVRMADEEADPLNILTQVAAARAALLAAGKIIIESHLRECVSRSFKPGKTEEAIQDIETVMSQFVK